jgi:hypothetical protein
MTQGKKKKKYDQKLVSTYYKLYDNYQAKYWVRSQSTKG